MGETSAYPLSWPQGWPRTPSHNRKDGRFSQYGKSLTVATARDRLANELDRIGARYVILSSNLELRLDGQPRSGQSQPEDRGVCCYFQLRGKPTVMPCDRYRSVEDNIAAIAAHIEATRAIERHGVGSIEQMFTGFQSIRGPGPKPWREVLGFEKETCPPRSVIEARRREMARTAHPDAGGSDAAMAEINAAADAGLAEIQ